MKIVSSGTDDKMNPFEYVLEGRSVGINTPNEEVTIEVQDLTKSVHIHATFAEIERAYNFCKQYSADVTPLQVINFLHQDGKLLMWCSGVRSAAPGDFLNHIVRAAFQADGDNLKIMYPMLRALMEKYPKYSDRNQHGRTL